MDMAGKGDASLNERLELFRARKKAVQKQLEELQETLDLLEFKCWYYEEAVKDGTDRRVRSLTIDEIPVQYRLTRQKMNISHSET